MAYLGYLRAYARKDPASLPASVLFSHSPTSLTIFDTFPKSIFHFLVLPRLLKGSRGSSPASAAGDAPAPLTANDLLNLPSLLKLDRERARDVLLGLRTDALTVKAMIEEEMTSRFGFRWGVWMGFHAVPSVEHLHLHVISADLCSDRMKHKKHYNSFHPARGFFLPIDEVITWFDGDAAHFAKMSKVDKHYYEPLLKEPLACFQCGHSMKNMPQLKEHLQEEWDKLEKKGQDRAKVEALLEKKRKRVEDADRSADASAARLDAPGDAKRQKSTDGDS